MSGWAVFGQVASSAMDLAGTILDAKKQEDIKDAQIHEADIARQESERMSNTAYQRARADMEAAGFNPMLAFQQGGASTPVFSAPSISGKTNYSGLGSSAYQRSLDTRSVQQNIATSKSQEELNSAQALKAKQEADLAKENTKRANLENQVVEAETPYKKSVGQFKSEQTSSGIGRGTEQFRWNLSEWVKSALPFLGGR